MCGKQSDREWFVDLGIHLDLHFNPLYEGAVYLCDVCWRGMKHEVEDSVNNYLEGKASGPNTIPSGELTETDRDPEQLVGESEPDNSEPVDGDNTIAADDSSSSESVEAFRGFFG